MKKSLTSNWQKRDAVETVKQLNRKTVFALAISTTLLMLALVYEGVRLVLLGW